MALFSRKKKEENVGVAASNIPAASTAHNSAGRDLSHILQHARITEKATMHSAEGVYTFDIAPRATKRDVMQAVRALYKVTPRRVAIVTVPSKEKRNARTGKIGMTGGGKKAYVYLKKGETITIG